jgi:hypothetical protein
MPEKVASGKRARKPSMSLPPSKSPELSPATRTKRGLSVEGAGLRAEG